MLFDKLCRFIEQHGTPESRHLMDDAKLFIFPYVAHEVLPHSKADGTTEELHLPFPTMAIEDEATCVLIHDLKPDNVGYGAPRRFIEFMPMDEERSNAFYDGRMIVGGKALQALPNSKDIYMISLGTIDGFQHVSSSEYRAFGELHAIFVFERDKMVYRALEREIPDNFRSPQLCNFVTALEEVERFNSPDRFILERTMVRVPRSHQNGPKILRSHERPQYTILKPSEIRIRMGLPEPQHDHASPRPHERRGHWRVFQDERFVHVKGQKKWIDPMWVGPSESVVGKHVYKVLLNR